MSAAELAMLVCAAFAAAVFLTIRLRAYAVAKGMMDQPNARSSHVVQTPRGGGAAIVLVTMLSLVYLWVAGAVTGAVFGALAGGGALVALAGWLDDRGGLSPGVRFLAHLAASSAVAAAVGHIGELQFGGALVKLGWVGFPISVLGLAWLINLTNFMDGIDGIAASQAAFVLTASYLLCGDASSGMVAGVATAAAACGFGVLNWPPAKIFMGDVGSGFLGFMIGTAVLMGANARSSGGIWPYLILSSAFIVDSTITLLRRMATGQKWLQPHRSHAYQHAARRWGHRAVTLTFLAVNLIWVLPLAWLATERPAAGAGLALICVLPLAGTAIYLGAGSPGERKPHSDEGE